MSDHNRPDPNRFDLNWIAFLAMALFMGIFLATRVLAKSKKEPDRCVVHLDSKTVAKIQIAVDGTVLDFPVKPTDVILGSKGTFTIAYVKSDLAISPTTLGSRSNLFAYLDGRRFSFSLSTTTSNFCPVLSIRDSEESRMQVEK